MTNPSVSCVMLLHDGREAMARKAIEAFHSQTYPGEFLELVILDTSTLPASISGERIRYNHRPRLQGLPIGNLRNFVNASAARRVIAHWDSDDWYAPERIAEQVAFLADSDAQCVGYNRVPFWREAVMRDLAHIDSITSPDSSETTTSLDFPTGEAWLYTGPGNRPIGSSLMYWRNVWQTRLFNNKLPMPGSTGEDVDFVRRIDARSCSYNGLTPLHKTVRMVARIHAGNTTSTYTDGTLEQSNSWRRAPELDEYCREVMG